MSCCECSDYSKEAIRIGTLVGVTAHTKSYIEQILPHGFESFELTFWQELGDIKLPKLAREVKEALGDSGAVIAAIGMYGNPLETGDLDKKSADGWKKLIDAAELFGTNVVCGFAGRVRGQSIDKSMPRFKQVFGPLAQRAKDKGVKLAFENCDMGGDWKTGDWNIAHNPTAWDMMFNEVPLDNIGLEWEPCHQMVHLIDPIPQLRKYAKRIFHVHGKDCTIQWDVVRECGIGGPKPFAYHRTPGFGDSNWADIISELRWAGFTGAIDIEGWHDPIYRGDLEMTGQVRALNYLKEARGGSFVANPVVPK